MTVGSDYKKRLTDLLSEIIEEGRRESGGKKFSYDKLAIKVNQKLMALGETPLSPQTFNNWHQGSYKRGLDDDSARKLGLYFDRPAETAAEDIKAYLAGKRTLSGESLPDSKTSPQDARAIDWSVVEAMRVAAIPDVVQAMEVGLQRLKEISRRQSDMLIIQLIRNALLERGLNPDRFEDLLEFARCIPSHFQNEAELADWVQQILQGRIRPTQEQLPDLAYAIQIFSDRNFSPEEMSQILSGEPNGYGHVIRQG